MGIQEEEINIKEVDNKIYGDKFVSYRYVKLDVMGAIQTSRILELYPFKLHLTIQNTMIIFQFDIFRFNICLSLGGLYVRQKKSS